jgi:hypothetical protein
MFNISRRAAMSVATVGALLTPLAAHADPLPVSDTVTAGGTGTITPGFPCPAAAPGCIITLTLPVVAFAGDEGVNTTSCTFTGNDIGGTLLAGSGTGSVSCGDGSSGSVTFSRIVKTVTLAGTITHNGVTHTILAGVCDFTPLSASGSPFAVVCEIVLVD